MVTDNALLQAEVTPRRAGGCSPVSTCSGRPASLVLGGVAADALGIRAVSYLVFHIFAALAEFERDLVRERTTAGLAAARARGRTGGRPTVMTDPKIKLAREVYASRQYTVAAIASALGVSRASIYRHLDDLDG
jgi:DNA invertase Pin-like site-specific DNA recombinase